MQTLRAAIQTAGGVVAVLLRRDGLLDRYLLRPLGWAFLLVIGILALGFLIAILRDHVLIIWFGP